MKLSISSCITAFAIALVTMISACKGQEENAGLLPRDKMQNMMRDIIVAEAYATMVKDSVTYHEPKNPDSLAAYYHRIFAHYGVKEEDFLKTLRWYKHHPSDLDSMVNKLLPEVKAWQDSLQAH